MKLFRKGGGNGDGYPYGNGEGGGKGTGPLYCTFHNSCGSGHELHPFNLVLK